MCTITTQTLRNLLKASPTQQSASQQHSLPKKTASPAEAAFDVVRGSVLLCQSCWHLQASTVQGRVRARLWEFKDPNNSCHKLHVWD